KVSLPELFKENIDIKNLNFDAGLSENLSKLVIDKLQLDLHGPILRLSGTVSNGGSWLKIKPSLALEAEIQNIAVADLEYYWPYHFGELAREWVIHNIKGGIIKHATGKFNFSEEDVANII